MKNCEYCGSANQLERERCFSCNAPFTIIVAEKKSVLDGLCTKAQQSAIEKLTQKSYEYEKILEEEMISKNVSSIVQFDKRSAANVLDRMFRLRMKCYD